MKQKLILLLFTLLTLNFTFAVNEVPSLNWDEDISVSVSVSLYPNPSSGMAFLEIETESQEIYHVSVVNLIGQEVFNQEVQTNDKVQMDLRNVPAGVYFVQIERGEEKVTKRLIIR